MTVVLPWLLPKRVYDLLIAVFAADSVNTVSVLESVPILGNFIRFTVSNYRTTSMFIYLIPCDNG